MATFASPADWVSPNSTEQEPYRSDPPPATGDKIIVTDSDHLWGLDPASVDWVWKSFLRGLHPIHMDPMTDDSLRIAVRLAMGHARQLARTLDLALLQPAGHRASTGYALADGDARSPRLHPDRPDWLGRVEVRQSPAQTCGMHPTSPRFGAPLRLRSPPLAQ